MRFPTMSKFTFCAMFAIVLCPGVVRASGTPASGQRLGPVNPRAGVSLGDLSSAYALGNTLALTENGALLAQADDQPAGAEGDVLGLEPKSPRRAFLKSLLIPGWGQWYTGNRWKPFLYLGLEAAGWLSWSNFRSKGDDLETEYQAFADSPETGWTYDRYENALNIVYDISVDTMKYTVFVDGVPQDRVFSHHIYPDTEGHISKNQTYYENIGKYDQFAFGWVDFPDILEPGDTTGVNFVTPNRQAYLKKRDNANREFNKASTVLILTIGNHLLSAFEAAWSAKRYNRSIDRFGSVDTDLRLTQSEATGKLMTQFALRYHF